MSLDDQAYLSPEIERFRERIKKTHHVYFDLVERLNTFCQRTKQRLEVHNRDGQEIFAGCLLLKILEDAQGAVLLLERGLTSQARSLLRVATEGVIWLWNICSNENFPRAFAVVGERKRLTLLRVIKTNGAPAFDVLRDEISDELLKEVAREIAEANIKEETIEKYADQVNLGTVYNATYRLFSLDVHSSPRMLHRFLELGQKEELESFRWGPEDEIRPELLEAARVLILAMVGINGLFELGIKEELDRFTAELGKLDHLASTRERPS